MTRRTDPHLFRQDPRERNIACKVCGGAPAEPIHLISADCGCLGDLHDRDNCPDRSQP